MSGAVLKGLPVTLGGQALSMPALDALTSKVYWERIRALQQGTEEDPLGLVSALVLACLRRNYPALTAVDVDPYIDMDNLDEMFTRCFGAGAFKRWCELQKALEEQSGNPTAQPEADGTGTRSTPPSPPEPVGGTETLTN